MHKKQETVHLWKYVTVCVDIVLLELIRGSNIPIFSANCYVININHIFPILISLLCQIDNFVNNVL
ncbi:hypothetical protein KL86DYS2_11445 [uncultured Dysgonomonas sp.]|uniref:Uncharacterized protein n=1 Tax=uncultured Dysgonomonas sp. TaxID=206096 RepID=A0A212JG74_9BACT|nr:hypothetical protein KL86DYS2_11445 [uncultured Dysgonomonas sp.]